jgi:hypothetical protein
MTKKTKVISLSVVGVLAAVVGLAMCRDNPAVKAAESMAKAVCACKDATCAANALDKGKDAIGDLGKVRGSEADARRIFAALNEAQACAARLGQ